MTPISIVQEQRLPIPSADQQLEFLNHIQQLIRLAETTSTYKFALLLSMTRLAIEQGESSGNTLTLNINDIAEKFIELYWNQARPFHFDEDPFVLMQNSGSAQAAVISLIEKTQKKYSTITKARAATESWKSLLNKVTTVINQNPIERLQIIHRTPVEFLYRYEDCTKTEIRLLPNVMYCLRAFNIIIEELCQKSWVGAVRLNRSNRYLFDLFPDLDSFMFDTNRNLLTKAEPILRELQENTCFYCGKKIAKDSHAIDHFIPWSLYQYDTGHNFVLTDRSCNSQKSNFLAADIFYQKWLKRNLIHNNFITHEMTEIGFTTSKERSENIANWAYKQIRDRDPDHGFWVPSKK